MPRSRVPLELYEPIGSYSHAVVAAGQIFIGAAGATLDDIVHLQVNLLDMADFPEMNRAYAEFFSEPYPARTVLGVSALPKPGARLTMNAVAVRRTG